MISRDEVTRILSRDSAIEVAIKTWEAAVDDEGCTRNAWSVLDLDSGQIRTTAWADRNNIPTSNYIILYTVSAKRLEAAAVLAEQGAEVQPSEDVVQEEAIHEARAGWRWDELEERLDRVYKRHEEEAR